MFLFQTSVLPTAADSAPASGDPYASQVLPADSNLHESEAVFDSGFAAVKAGADDSQKDVRKSYDGLNAGFKEETTSEAYVTPPPPPTYATEPVGLYLSLSG